MAETQTRTALKRVTPESRAQRAQQVADALSALNDVILGEPRHVGTELLRRWRAFRDRWNGWYRDTTATTWWWDATSKVVESYAEELETFRAAHLRALAPRPVLPPAPAPLADLVTSAQVAPVAPQTDWTPLVVLGAVGVGIWWLGSARKEKSGADDDDFGVRRILARGGKDLGIDEAQVPELQFEEVDIEDDDEDDDPDEYEDDLGNIMVRSSVPGFYVPKPWAEREREQAAEQAAAEAAPKPAPKPARGRAR